MKKTYKTFNGENRNCFFKVGKALVEARFTPTYTTDNEFVQNAIEDSYSFKAGELQLVTPSMTWIKITERFPDKDVTVLAWCNGKAVLACRYRDNMYNEETLSPISPQYWCEITPPPKSKL